MTPYSDALRERVLAACAEGACSVDAVAARFRVSVSFVRKLRRRQRTTGSGTALPHRGGPAPLLNAAARATPAACVARQPDATLDELRAQLAPAAGRTTVWQALQALNLRRKKRASTRPSATPNA